VINVLCLLKCHIVESTHLIESNIGQVSQRVVDHKKHWL